MPKWYPKKFSNEERIHTAIKILNVLKERYKESLISVVVEGSSAKGLDAPESDLELRVLLDKEYDYHRWYSFFYKEMFVGISYNSYSRFLEESKEIDYEWPISGDVIKTAKVIYDPNGVYSILTNNNKIAEQNADYKALIRESVSDMYEHIYKIFTLTDTNRIGITQELINIAYWAAITVGLVNKINYVSNKSMIEDSYMMDNTPKNYEQNIRDLFENKELKTIKSIVSILWNSFDKWICQLGIELNDDSLHKI